MTNPMRVDDSMKEWEGYIIQLLPIEKLIQVCPTKDNFRAKVREQIEKNGMKLPLLTVDIATKRLRQWYRNTKGIGMLPPPKRRSAYSSPTNDNRGIAVFGGNTRLVVAKELHYTHIDCIVLDWWSEDKNIKGERMEYMWSLQKNQRKKFPEMYPHEKELR